MTKFATKTIQIKKIPATLWLLISICLLTMLFTSPTNAFQPDETDAEDALRFFARALFSMENDLYLGHGLLDYSTELKLTPKQKEKIEDMVLEHEAVFLRKSAEIKIKELRLTAYLKSDRKKLDRKVVEQYIREISKEKTDLSVKLMNHLLDLKKLLTPDQIKTARQLRQSFIKARRNKPPKEARKNE